MYISTGAAFAAFFLSVTLSASASPAPDCGVSDGRYLGKFVFPDRVWAPPVPNLNYYIKLGFFVPELEREFDVVVPFMFIVDQKTGKLYSELVKEQLLQEIDDIKLELSKDLESDEHDRLVEELGDLAEKLWALAPLTGHHSYLVSADDTYLMALDPNEKIRIADPFPINSDKFTFRKISKPECKIQD